MPGSSEVVLMYRQRLTSARQDRRYAQAASFYKSASLKDRLAAFAEEAREKASHLPPGLERDEMLKKVDCQ
jgi:hypothetical protein